ncbi:MAG: class I SAM-dependent methyltransferase [Microthrixaceae bacterium]
MGEPGAGHTTATSEGSGRGDLGPEWRAHYARVRKDALAPTSWTNRRRLELLGAGALDRGGLVLDLGAGDGNLTATLVELGFRRVVAVELQPELAAAHTPGAVVAGCATRVPLATGSVDTAVVMDVLHHLRPDELDEALRELHRVVRPGGTALVCEPAATRLRAVLEPLLRGPLGGLTSFSRAKREMVELEWPTLGPWLAAEPRAADRYRSVGFDLTSFRRRGLHHLARLHRPT